MNKKIINIFIIFCKTIISYIIKLWLLFNEFVLSILPWLYWLDYSVSSGLIRASGTGTTAGFCNAARTETCAVLYISSIFKYISCVKIYTSINYRHRHCFDILFIFIYYTSFSKKKNKFLLLFSGFKKKHLILNRKRSNTWDKRASVMSVS